MKKSLFAIALVCGILSLNATSAKAEISQRTLQSFHSVFAEAKHVKWMEFPDHYLVSFSQNDVLVKASYDRDGNLLNSIRYYKEQRLPLNILCKVKKENPNRNIEIVTEVSNEEGVVYFIQLKDKKGWTILKSDASGNLELTDKFQDANR